MPTLTRFTLTRSAANPILSPLPGSPWESLVTTNPAAVYDDARQKFILLYRAAGHDPEHRIHLGLAESDDGIHFTRVSDRPVLSPGNDSACDGGGMEDPRLMKIGDWFYLTYASRPYPPGQYWLHDGAPFIPPDLPAEFPIKFRETHTTTHLAATRDFKTWHRFGPITDPVLDDRDVYLFPEKIGGKWWMIHRPMQWTGDDYGTRHPAIWINASDDLLSWNSAGSRLLACAEQDWEVKIGGNTPPLRTAEGWMTIYHGKGPDGFYRLGALLLDLENPARVTHRTRDWFLEPECEYETRGCYDQGGVVFPCGAVLKDGTLFVYYGGADKYCAVATAPMADFMENLLANPT
ncbi:putative glycosylase [Opitutaceae bacterium TAV1]|nr:putative glycosylase [Opitutaceae bacterium TAV1]